MGAESVAERLRSLLESRHKEKDEEKQKQKNDFNNNKSHTQTSTSARVDKFLPGRSCYVYHLDGDDDEKGGELNFDDPFGTGIPTTVYRSKSEYTQQKFKYVLKLEEDAPIIARLAGVLGYMRKGSKGSHNSSGGGRGGVFSSSSTGKGKDPKGFQKSPSSAEQLKRETPQQGTVAVAEADSEDDIFADCGTDFNEDEDGEAEMKRETKVGDYGGNGSSRYFSGLGGDGTGAEESEKRVREKKQARAREEVTYTYRDLEDQEDRDVMEVRQKKHEGLGDEGNWHQVMKSGEDDAYADLFPGYGAGLDDEEEEDDGEKALVTTIDEEEAAGEGGDKSTTRAKGKGKMKANSKSSTKDVKLNTEYSKMKELFKEKGFGNATAFEEAEEEPGEGSSKGNAKKKNKNKNKNKKDANDSGDVTFQPRQKRLRL